MVGNKSTVEIATEYNIAKSTIRERAKKYGNIANIKILFRKQVKFIGLTRFLNKRT